MTRIAWGSGACPGCGHFWAQHATPPELERGITCHGLGTCTCRLARMAALVGLEEGAGLPLEYRDEGEVVAHLDAVAVAARNLFEGLQHAMAAVLRRAPAPLPQGPARHWTLVPVGDDGAAVTLVTVPDGMPVDGAQDARHDAPTPSNPRRDIARGMGEVRRALLHLARRGG